MGKKKSTPKPPTVRLPGPTEQEKQIQQAQLDIMKQLQAQGSTSFGWATDSYNQGNKVLQNLSSDNPNNPLVRPWTADEQKMLDQSYQANLQTLLNGIDTGTYKNLYDRNQADTVAALQARGVLDSRTGRQAIGDLETQRQSDITQANQQAYNQRLQMEQQLRASLNNTDLARAQIYGGLSTNQGALATQANSSGANTGAQLGGSLSNERYAQASTAAQNAQSQYLWQLSNFNQNKGGGLGGAAVGGLSGAATGAAFGPWGAAIGGTLGAIGGYF